MARIEMGPEAALMAAEAATGETFFRLGLMYSTGSHGSPDRVAAHKWFNIAAARGYRPAAEYRREIAVEMGEDEVREALRQAREFLTLH